MTYSGPRRKDGFAQTANYQRSKNISSQGKSLDRKKERKKKRRAGVGLGLPC